MKSILLGIWACLTALVADYAAMHYREQRETAAKSAPEVKVESRYTREFNVPRIKNGQLRGYIVSKLHYTVAINSQAQSDPILDAVVVDEGFRYLYNDDTIDFDHLERINLDKLSKSVLEAVNTRMGSKMLLSVDSNELSPLAESAQPKK